MDSDVINPRESVEEFFPLQRLLAFPPPERLELEFEDEDFLETSLESQRGLLRLVNAFPYAGLDIPILTRMALIISVSVCATRSGPH